MDAAENLGALVTVGIGPTRPETGYGYIEIAEGATSVAGDPQTPVFPVKRFREKPNLETAEEFISTGRFLWNSGMFFWRVSDFLAEFDEAAPEFSAAAREMAQAMARADVSRVNAVFEALDDISIDYALMERARRVLVVRGDFGWDDVGSWDALDRSMPHDGSGNVCVGEPVLLDTQRCIVYNEPGLQRMAVATLGCEDLVIVACDDAVLVMPKRRAQEVKQVVAELKKRKAAQL